MLNITYILLSIFTLIVYFFYYTRYLHIFQLEGYKHKGYFHWFLNNIKHFILPICLSIISLILIPIMLHFNIDVSYVMLITSGIMLIFYIIDILKQRKTTYKKALVYTWRAKRILITGYVLLSIYLVISYLVAYKLNFPYLFNILFILLYDIAGDTILISNYILKPVEKLCGLKFINEAKQIINDRKDLIVIGITGSFGKTSSKFILQTILSEKYNTYATSDSYNTTFGNVRVIREKLTNVHQIYISEMGARNIGDIKEICDIVKPKYGLITSIGNQHLETFKTIENIIKTKYELIDSLPIDGIAFFPDDNGNCKKLYDDEKRNKVLIGSNNSDVYAKDIEVSKIGSKFTVVCKLDNSEFTCKTKLLGKHNIQNILCSIAISKKLDLTNEEIARGVSKIASIPHRLELIPNTNGLTIVDDAFNSNPWGAKAALEVISNFPGRKIIITPGMIELGNQQYNANFNFGKQIADVCDIVILVGKNITIPIQDGIKETNFNLDNMYIVSSLDEATKKLAQVGQIGDTVLFENDLPDNFNE